MKTKIEVENALAAARADLQAVMDQINTIEAEGRTDPKSAQVHAGLWSRKEILQAAIARLESDLVPAELNDADRAVDEARIATDQAKVAYEARRAEVAAELRERFDYPNPPTPFETVVETEKSVCELARAFQAAASRAHMLQMTAATRRRELQPGFRTSGPPVSSNVLRPA